MYRGRWEGEGGDEGWERRGGGICQTHYTQAIEYSQCLGSSPGEKGGLKCEWDSFLCCFEKNPNENRVKSLGWAVKYW